MDFPPFPLPDITDDQLVDQVSRSLARSEPPSEEHPDGIPAMQGELAWMYERLTVPNELGPGEQAISGGTLDLDVVADTLARLTRELAVTQAALVKLWTSGRVVPEGFKIVAIEPITT